jgi:hypothetical protein
MASRTFTISQLKVSARSMPNIASKVTARIARNRIRIHTPLPDLAVLCEGDAGKGRDLTGPTGVCE